MSKLADNEEELVLEDQTISPGSPRVNPKDLDEVVQLLVTVEIENGGNVSEDVEKTTEVVTAQATEATEAVLAVEEAVQNGEEKPEQPCEEVKEDEEEAQEVPPPEVTEEQTEEITQSGKLRAHSSCFGLD